MKTIAIFNNKGGVGKTTFCGNLAAHIAMQNSKRVLVLDLDPQANMTHYMLGAEMAGEVVAPYYDRSITKAYNTIVDVFKPYELGESRIDTDISAIQCERYGADLIAGNPFLAAYEDILSKKWNELSSPDSVSGLRITNWVTSLLRSVDKKYDYTFIDLSPSLGAINRTALLASDYFLAPMSCDIFSLIGIANIHQWINNWVQYYNERRQTFAASKPDVWQTIGHDIQEIVKINSGFVGYTLQSYISRKDAQGNKRTTHSYQRIIDNIQPEILSKLGDYRAHGISDDNLNLGEIPHMFGILALSQFVGAPIISLNSSDGMAGSQYTQARSYINAFEQIMERFLENIGEGRDDVA
ncbi:AAA family ATPase [Candidatus Roizmanbacteria bacterium]|nr:AAA family ATPase [Candidatus Roizmanbacteria bacterium]